MNAPLRQDVCSSVLAVCMSEMEDCLNRQIAKSGHQKDEDAEVDDDYELFDATDDDVIYAVHELTCFYERSLECSIPCSKFTVLSWILL